jgi:hypothetical protein
MSQFFYKRSRAYGAKGMKRNVLLRWRINTRMTIDSYSLFTPSHKSSPYFATYVGSVLQGPLGLSSTCSWLDHPVSGQIDTTIYNFITPTPKGLSLLYQFTRWPIMQKVRR